MPNNRKKLEICRELGMSDLPEDENSDLSSLLTSKYFNGENDEIEALKDKSFDELISTLDTRYGITFEQKYDLYNFVYELIRKVMQDDLCCPTAFGLLLTQDGLITIQREDTATE